MIKTVVRLIRKLVVTTVFRCHEPLCELEITMRIFALRGKTKKIKFPKKQTTLTYFIRFSVKDLGQNTSHSFSWASLMEKERKKSLLWLTTVVLHRRTAGLMKPRGERLQRLTSTERVNLASNFFNCFFHILSSRNRNMIDHWLVTILHAMTVLL